MERPVRETCSPIAQDKLGSYFSFLEPWDSPSQIEKTFLPHVDGEDGRNYSEPL